MMKSTQRNKLSQTCSGWRLGRVTALLSAGLLITACNSGGGEEVIPGIPAVSIDSSNVTAFSENGGSTSFTVALASAPLSDVVVDVVSNDTTEAAADLSSLTFTPGDWGIPQTITVSGVNDMLVDGNQDFDVVVSPNAASSVEYAVLPAQNIAMTVQDDDAAAITIDQSTVAPFSENGGTTTFSVVLNTEPMTDVVIDVVNNDTTEAALDLSSLIFTAADWSTPQTVTVNGVDDMLVDGNQAFNIVVTPNASSSSEYASLVAQNIAVTVQDDDTAGVTVDQSAITPFSENGGVTTFTVVLNTIPDNDVVLDVVSSDTTEASLDVSSLTFTSADWDAPQTVTINGVDDLLADGNQTFDITIAVNGVTIDTTGYAVLSIPPVSVTSSDDDTAGITVSKTVLNTDEGGTVDTFTVVLNSMPDGDVVIDIASTVLTEATVDKASLTFATGTWDVAQTVSVVGVNDDVIDGNQPLDITLTVNGSTADTTGYAALTLPAISLTNTDNDTAAFTFVSTPVATAENGSVQTFTVRPNTQPLTGNTIDLSIVSADLSEGTVSPAVLSWDELDWQTAKTVTVTPVDDLVDDGNVVYNIELDPAASTEAPYQTVGLQTASVTNSDDDVAGFTIVGDPVSTVENGAPHVLTISPNTQPQPGTEIVIFIIRTDQSEASVSTTSLFWRENDWQTPKSVNVIPVDDTIADGTVAYEIQLDPRFSSTDLAYKALPLQIIPATNADDESPYVSAVSPVDGSVDIPLNSTFSVTFTKSMLVSSITTNTVDTTCSGTIQVSKDNFASCVQMSGVPVASVSDTTFTVTPSANLVLGGVYHIRVTTGVVQAVDSVAMFAQFNTTTGIAAQKYIDNGDGTITDANGVMWQKSSDTTFRKYDEAVTYCSALALGGSPFSYTNWRLPTEAELTSLLDFSITPTIDTNYFTGGWDRSYLSSTQGAYNDAFNTTTHVAIKYDGSIPYATDYMDIAYGYVRCVRP